MRGFVSCVVMIIALIAIAFSQPSPRVNPIDDATLVRVPAGEFVMGNDVADIDRMWRRLGWDPNWKQHTRSEQPAHRVRLDGFWMYRDLVTVAQYRKFCGATSRQMPQVPTWGWKENHPVVNVSWVDAKAYCAWAKGRLPSEAEWEYAASGGKGRTTFIWGNDLPRDRKVANLADESFRRAKYYGPSFRNFQNYDDGYPYTSPVDAYPANGLGLRDMTGNVWQWCEDRYAADYYRNSPISNPKGPAQGSRRVLRGGAFDTPPEMTRVNRRLSNNPDVRQEEKGFRCVQDAPGRR